MFGQTLLTSPVDSFKVLSYEKEIRGKKKTEKLTLSFVVGRALPQALNE